MRGTLSVAVLLVALFVAPQAHAAEYVVSACRDAADGANHAWTLTNSEPRSLDGTDCGPSEPLWLAERLLVRNASPAAVAEWSFVAPPGTRVTALDYDRWARVFSDRGWRAGLRTDEGELLDGCTFSYPQNACEFGSRHGHGRAAFHGLSTSRLSFGARCVPVWFGACETGGTLHSLEMVLYGARVTVEDHEAPAVSAPQTALGDGSWHREAIASLGATASDNTGIRVRRVLVDGVERHLARAPGAAEGGCGDPDEGVAYTYARPCDGARGLNGPQTTSLDVSRWPEGTHAVRVRVTDTGGLENTSEPVVVRLDRSGPPAPGVLTDDRWSALAGGEASWTVPVEHDRAPIARVETEVCLPSECSVRVRAGAWHGAELREALPSLPEGETTVRVRLTDAAGNAGPWSAGAVLRRDRRPPRLSLSRVPASVAPEDALAFGAEATDDRSGVERIEREYQVDGGGWSVLPRTLSARAGSIYRFRARAIDRAGNATDWLVSGQTTTAGTSGPASRPAPEPVGAPSPPLAGTARPTASALRIASATVGRGVLRLRGTLGPTRSGRLAVTLAAGSARTTWSADVRTGRFSLTKRLPRRLARAGRGVLTVRFAGSPAHAPASVRSVLRWTRTAP